MKEKIFGRQQYLDLLAKRVSDLKSGFRQNLAIIGQEFVGKTSLVFKFLEKFSDPHILVVYLEARPEPLASFTRRFIGVLLYNFMLNSGLALKEDLDFLIKKSSPYIPKTVERTKEILASLERKQKNNLFAELLSLCELLHAESGKFCVVILDEFHNLESFGAKNLYSEWSRVLISQKHTLYVIISSRKFKAKNILSKNLSLLFGNFEALNIGPFELEISQRYLEEKFASALVPLEPGIKEFIVNFTGGYPFYLNIIADSCIKSTSGELADTLEELLFEPSGVLSQRFSNYLKRFTDLPNSQDYLSLLYLVSRGHNKIRDIAHLLRKGQKEVTLRLNYLLESDCLAKSGDFLFLEDRVFSFWLRFVYEGKQQSLTFNAKNQKALFRSKIEAMIEEFLLQAGRPLHERVTDLLRQFGDETIQIEKKRLKLSHFREVKPLEFTYSRIKDGLIGRSQDSLWIIAFKPEMLTEEDIAEFSRECKKYRNKLQRKIIIAFQEIDSNARLRAMEEKVWTWDISHLNQIFDAYSQPRVVAAR